MPNDLDRRIHSLTVEFGEIGTALQRIPPGTASHRILTAALHAARRRLDIACRARDPAAPELVFRGAVIEAMDEIRRRHPQFTLPTNPKVN